MNPILTNALLEPTSDGIGKTKPNIELEDILEPLPTTVGHKEKPVELKRSRKAASVITLPKVVEPESTSRSSADPSPGAAEQRYAILEEHGYTVFENIGSGSFSKVKQARSRREDQIVAIKIVSKSRAPRDYLDRFLPREIDVVKGLSHVNIIRYYRCIETTRRVYIIMQYAENGSLLDRIRARGQFEESFAKHVYRQLMSAIEYCHRHGVVHRDVKCENLLFDSADVLKLIDFGFSRKYNDRMPHSETYCGSYAYACPQILRGVPYDPHFADVWASGVVLFAMVFGRLPFDDSSMSRLLRQVNTRLNFAPAGKLPVSDGCKAFLQEVMVRDGRSTIGTLQKHRWLTEGGDKWQAGGGAAEEVVSDVFRERGLVT